MSIGVAAHITAAAAGGPRFDASITAEQRSDISNGIWLCQSCAKLIDSDVGRFPSDLLREWKKQTEQNAFKALATSARDRHQRTGVSEELDDDDRKFLRHLALAKDEDVATVTERMLQAAANDIAAFRNVREWPSNVIELNLALSANGKGDLISLTGIANAIGVVDTLWIISPPGTGKTTTIIQLAGKIIDLGHAVPALVPLGEWASNRESLFAFLMHRNAFRGFREQHFQLLAFHGRLVILVDGWNEVTSHSRVAAIRQIKALQRDFPQLSVVISTRRQMEATSGPIIEIGILSEEQQLEMARRVGGGSKEAVLDQAWRIPGIRDLVAIPLYLNALLNSTQEGSFPQTKDELLNSFAAQHEVAPEKAETLKDEVLGLHREMLVGLAVHANKLGLATISEREARLAISQVGARLVSEGQITVCPQPAVVLETLVNAHSLVRSPSGGGSLSFQHQQFQDWYASFEVERLILKAAQNDAEAKKALRTQILNLLPWEESILFACERLSRNTAGGARAAAFVIMETLGIDPMLAAEMIYRADDLVWAQIKDAVIYFASRWHRAGEVDRGVRFMITTGRAEFAPQIWPLVANSDSQIHLNALRKARRFRPSVLGPDRAKRLSELPDDIRGQIVAEIACESGFDGLELAVQIAKRDPIAKVVVHVLHALDFRRADRHVCEILEGASEEVWKQLAAEAHSLHLTDPSQKARLASLRTAQELDESEPISNIYRLLNRTRDDAFGERIAKILEADSFPVRDQNGAFAIKRAFDCYPDQVRTALFRRVQGGLPVPFNSDDILKDLPVIDDGPLAAAVLDKSAPFSRFAATIIGPETIGKVLDEFFVLAEKVHAQDHQIEEETREEYSRLKEAIISSRQECFVPALLKRAHSDSPRRIQMMADLLSLHGEGKYDMRALVEHARDQLIEAIGRWSSTLLTSPEANRHQMADVVRAMVRLPQPQFAEHLEKMLERDLGDQARAREEFKRSRRRGLPGPTVSLCHTREYQKAFAAIGGSHVITLMKRYLTNLEFGADAALVLSDLWAKENGPPKQTLFGIWHDFSDVKTKRLLRQDEHNLPASSHYAEAIFAVVRQLGTKENEEAAQKHAIRLATVGLQMPHGSKRPEIDALMALPIPLASKRKLLIAAAQAGEIIRVQDLTAGLQELLDLAQKEPWRLDKQNGELMGWIELFPFSDQPTAVFEMLDAIPKRHREPWDLGRLLIALADSPHKDALAIFRRLAEWDERILDNCSWFHSLLRIGNEAAAGVIIDFICDGRLLNFSPRKLADFGRRYLSIRRKLLQCYATMPPGAASSALESVLVEIADAETVLALVRYYGRNNRRYDGHLSWAIREAAVGKRSLGGQPNVYNQFSVPLTDLRKELFAMASANDSESALTMDCLNQIEELRDEYGRVNDEPRHPDIDSGYPWPILASQPHPKSTVAS